MSIVVLPLALAACTPGSNSNTNAVVLDLVNEATNTASALNQSASAGNANAVLNTNGAVNGNTNAAANTNTSSPITVYITSTGFSPSTVTVKAGTVVTWTNSSGGSVEVASDPHPTHTNLPGFVSSALGNGASYSFTFTKVGTWGYHDHLHPTVEGTVIVQ